MKLSEHKIEDRHQEGIVLEYVEFTKEFDEIKDFILNQNKTMNGYIDRECVQIPISDILYFEAVRKLVFAYTENQVYEIKYRLYQIEENLKGAFFLRSSKSTLLHVTKILSLEPALNGRFYATMSNGEKVMISRQYAADIKKCIIENMR